MDGPDNDKDPILGKRALTRDALRGSVFRAVNALEADLASPPSIEDLARAAGLSKYHFQRAFKACVGESPGQHLTRLRVERAASFLRFSSWQVGEIAHACGFATQSSFGRSFRKFYGMTPRQFRLEKGSLPFLRGRLRQSQVDEQRPLERPAPTSRIEEWPTLCGIALRHYGTVQSVIKAWDELICWADSVDVPLKDSRFFGLWFDDWNTSKSHFRYEALIVPPHPPALPPSPFHVRTIPGGLVAIAYAEGRLPVLDQAWQAFGTGWLPFSGYQPRLNFAIDEYPRSLLLSHWKQLKTLFKGTSLHMILPIQHDRIEI